MKIGIFSKLGASGGSEHRVAEMANGIAKYTGHECHILAENNINSIIKDRLDSNIKTITNIFKPQESANPEILYDYDTILVVNSDSYSFARAEYWEGTLTDKKGTKPKHHPFYIDLARIPQMVFLFNFVISPAQWLDSIAKKCKNVKIVTANNEFYQQLEYKDKFDKKVKKLPRMVLESPIDPHAITPDKTSREVIRIGKHSKAHDYKHNEQWPELINMVNNKYGNIIEWDFLGVPNKYVNDIKDIPNVTVRNEYSIPVGEYLKGIDIFCFFISWGRCEPWARAVAEGMMAGCPILATDKAGNRDQVYHGLNGFLCGTVDDFANSIYKLIEDQQVFNRMRENNIMCSEYFTPDKIINKFMEFIN